MNLKNYRDYAAFNYTSAQCPHHKLGDVVINEENEIGVIIQIHEEGEYRTEMFGNCSLSLIRLATKEEIKKYRPNLKTSAKFPISTIIKELEEIKSNVYRVGKDIVYDLDEVIDKLRKYE